MKRHLLLTKLILFSFSLLIARNGKHDGYFKTYNGESRTYSLYVPSSYQHGKPTALMVSFHPFGRYRWDSKRWRDELVNFAENNQLILLCPDGGLDGRTDEKDDMDFSLQLLHQVKRNYSIDFRNVYLMGYSWGAKAALKFGLSHPNLFKGLILVGMASDQPASEFASFFRRARNKRIFLLHGEYDSPSTRFQPLHDQLIRAGACLGFKIIKGGGHSFNFDKQISHLDAAYKWLQNSPCYQLPEPFDNKPQYSRPNITIFPNPGVENESLWVRGIEAYEVHQIRIFDRSGILIRIVKNFHPQKPIEGLSRGDYYFVFYLKNQVKVSKQVLIR